MPLIGAGRNVSPRVQTHIDNWLTGNGWSQGGGGIGTGAMSENFDASLSLPAGFATGGDANWFVQNTTFYSSPNAAESGNIGDSQKTSLYLIRDGITSGMTITFDYKVDTENTWDWLEFYINSVNIQNWSGNSGGFVTYSAPLNVGLNTIEWRYVKDSSSSVGADTVWIDNIVIA